MLDGIEKLHEGQRPPKVFLLEWIGETLQGYDYRYKLYKDAIVELAGFYNAHGFKMMVLKGYACSLNWPKPEHRPCGDIDIWLFGKQPEADCVIKEQLSVEIDNSHMHHTVFFWHDFMVENHYDIVNTEASRSNAKIEKIFKTVASDDNYSVDVCGEKIHIPSPNLHALFLLRHGMLHFTRGGLNLRQVLDWGFFVKENGSEVDWNWLMAVLDEYGMNDFFNCINSICVEELGFSNELFPICQFDESMRCRVVYDMLAPEFDGVEPQNFFARIPFKLLRRKKLSWKHQIAYKESIGSHLLA